MTSVKRVTAGSTATKTADLDQYKEINLRSDSRIGSTMWMIIQKKYNHYYRVVVEFVI